jgi:predicted RNA-binding protein with TRAM domain
MTLTARPILLLLLLSVCACQTREIGSAAPGAPNAASAQPAPKKKQILFVDDFNRAEIGPAWKRGEGERGSGQWKIEDGWLTGEHIKNDPLWLIDAALPADVRVEFDAKSMTAVGDLKAEIFGDGVAHASGYIVIFGGWKNSLDVIARLDEHGQDRKAQPTHGVKQGQVHRVAIERFHGELRFEVDGVEIMRYPDARPLVGDKHDRFAFNDWDAPVRFDNISIWALE